ncbi:MAG: hypothetical protein ABJA84_05180 [Polaromonas sp.]
MLAGGPGFGQGQHDLLASFPHKHTLLALLALLALLRDGFHDDAPGGKVKLRSDGSAVLTLYGAVNCLAQGLVKNLTGRDVTLA